MMPPIIEARFDELTPRQLYGILRLRVEVFGVEQDCAYQDLDGRDMEPGTLLLWQEDPAGRVISTVRILEDGPHRIIGRVVTDRAQRGQGLAGQLIRRALELTAGHQVSISAQAHLQRWYETLGFERHGEEYLEDGIPHVAMQGPADA